MRIDFLLHSSGGMPHLSFHSVEAVVGGLFVGGLFVLYLFSQRDVIINESKSIGKSVKKFLSGLSQRPLIKVLKVSTELLTEPFSCGVAAAPVHLIGCALTGWTFQESKGVFTDE